MPLADEAFRQVGADEPGHAGNQATHRGARIAQDAPPGDRALIRGESPGWQD